MITTVAVNYCIFQRTILSIWNVIFGVFLDLKNMITNTIGLVLQPNHGECLVDSFSVSWWLVVPMPYDSRGHIVSFRALKFRRSKSNRKCSTHLDNKMIWPGHNLGWPVHRHLLLCRWFVLETRNPKPNYSTGWPEEVGQRWLKLDAFWKAEKRILWRFGKKTPLGNDFELTPAFYTWPTFRW